MVPWRSASEARTDGGRGSPIDAVSRAAGYRSPIASSLDRNSAGELASILTRMAADGRVVVVASHDPDVIAKADVTYRLEHGRLTQLGVTPALPMTQLV